jgi:hypothetical protein
MALSILAGLQGPQALTGFNAGRLQRQYYEDERTQRAQVLARQQQLDEERRQQQAAQDARAQAAEARAEAAARRAEEHQRLQTLQTGVANLTNFGTQVAESAGDPIAAENTMLGRAAALEGALNIPQGQLSPFIPNMTPVVTRGVRADARALMNDADAKIAKIPGASVDDGVSFPWGAASPRLQGYLRTAGYAEGEPFKPSQIREIAGAPIVQAPPKPRILPDVPLDRQLAAAIASGDTVLASQIEEAMRRQGATRDTGPSPSERRTALRDTQSDLRAQLRDALEHPDQQQPGELKRLAGEFAKNRLDFEREMRTVRQQIERDRLDDTRRRRLAADPLEALLDDADTNSVPVVPGGRAAGAGPIGGRGAAVGPTGARGGIVQVQTPDGQVFTFPTQKAADDFRRAAGIR